jgi:hypothetical protein
MCYRLEYKFLVPVSLIDSIRADVNPFVNLDPFAEKQNSGEYTVRSIYYDTPKFDCYHEKIEGIKVRKKYRIRGYNVPEQDEIAFLEIKRKYNNHINKNRAPILNQNLQSFLVSRDLDKHILSFSGNGKEQNDAQRFLFHYYRDRLKPVVLINYEREAFVGKFDSTFRITFDKNLRSAVYPSLESLYKEDQMKYSMMNNFILEVKFNSGLPKWIKSILTRYNLLRKSLSKYTICLDSHRVMKKSNQRKMISQVSSKFRNKNL